MAMLTRRSCLRLAALGLAAVAPGSIATLAMPAVRKLGTPAGIDFWLIEERSIPLVSLRFSFAGGGLTDPAGKEGLANLMAALLTEGAGEHDADAFAQRIADLGTQVAISGRRDRVLGGIDALTRRLDGSIALLAAALAVPRFDATAVERTRQQRLAEVETEQSEPRRQAFDRWWAGTFADVRGPGRSTAVASP